MTTFRSELKIGRLRPLVACLVAALSVEVAAASTSRTGAGEVARFLAERGLQSSPALSIARNPDHVETTLVVTNCDDAGTDSLRDVVGVADTIMGDVTITFDMNAMQCSNITLTSGQIDINRENLTIQGPGMGLLTISGGYSSGYFNRILKHSSSTSGVLEISGLTLADAKYMAPDMNHDASGGCIYSPGTIGLDASTITGCRVLANGGSAQGGGAFAGFSMTLSNSVVSGCKATSQFSLAYGGGLSVGVVAGGVFLSSYSVIENNVAYGPALGSDGGGIYTRIPSVFQYSTVSGNEADFGSGIRGRDTAIVNSTISGNISSTGDGAVELAGAAYVYNTTIAFNRTTAYGNAWSGGLYATASVHSYSSIFAYNYSDDGMGHPVGADVRSGDNVVTGTNNLIIAGVFTTLPGDTSSACPRLAPLLNNGGPTRTHALFADSPAIDVGSNPGSVATDQRGPSYPRTFGPFTDIGAFEWGSTQDDVINAAGFDCG